MGTRRGRLERVRRRVRGQDAADLTDRLDRSHHWITHVDARQQELSGAVAAIASSVAAIEQRLADMASDVAGVNDLRRDLHAVARTVAVAGEQIAAIDPPRLDGGPLVSVVCPFYPRPELVDRAIAEVAAQTYDRWELLLVDDGTPGLSDSDVARWCAQPGVTLVRTEHGGACAARNRGLASATGDIVAYLDVDNSWHPTYLARVVDALDRRPSAGWTVASQLVVRPGEVLAVRDDRHDMAELDRGNFIDLNAVAHRRSLLDLIGGFDEERGRLGDWDLAQRLASVAGEPVRISAIGSVYHDDADPHRVTMSTPLHPHLSIIRARGRGHPAKGLKVLFAEWHYPQASESYVRADLLGLLALGADVEVWSESDVAVRYEPDAPLHRGSLDDTIAAVRPDIVVTHWLHIGTKFRPAVRAAGVPLAVRGHGFDFRSDVLRELLDDPGVIVHLFPHLAGSGHPRERALAVAFDQERYAPVRDKDRRLVVRTGVGLHTKDYDSFFAAAVRCPDHRFVLSLCRGYLVEDVVDEIVARRDDMRSPAEIMVDAPVHDVADLVSRAGIYFHTHGREHAYGMSVSIAEALGTGCYVIAPDLPGMRGYVGAAADLYDDAAGGAALVQQTVHWDDARWTGQWLRATDHAHVNFGAAEVADVMVDQWREVLGVRPAHDAVSQGRRSPT